MIGLFLDDGSLAGGNTPTDDDVALRGGFDSLPGMFGASAASENGDRLGASLNALQTLGGNEATTSAGDNTVEGPTENPAPDPGAPVAVQSQPDPAIPPPTVPIDPALPTHLAGGIPQVGPDVPSGGGSKTPAGGDRVVVSSNPDPAIPVASLGRSQTIAGAGAVVNAGPSGTGVMVAAQVGFSLGVAGMLERSGNDLPVPLVGADPSATVAGSLTDNGTAGTTRIHAQIAQFVQAMATHSANDLAFDATTAVHVANDSGLHGVIAAAWPT